jgi:hypothetical protein
MSQTRYTENVLVKPFFRAIVRVIKENGLWGNSGGVYRISHSKRTFTLIRRNGDDDMLELDAICIPKYTGYRVEVRL